MSERFDIGSSITWLEAVESALDSNGNEYIAHGCLTGTIISLTPHTILVQIGLSRERFSKASLADRVFDQSRDTYDAELGDIIRSTIGQSQTDLNDTTKYDVYTLSDPCTGIIHYIGISKNIQRRYKQHCSCSGVNLQKNIWILQLLQKKQQPILTILETAQGRKTALERENVWIQHYQALGMPLTNLEGVEA